MKLPGRDQVLERGKTDLRYLIESSFFIVDKHSRKVPFIFNKAQNDYWDKIRPRDVVLKSRKMGFTSLRLARMIAKCQVMEYRRCVVVSHELKSTERLLHRAHFLIENSLIKIETKTKSAAEISFPGTKSSIWIGTAGQKAFGRGDDITDFENSEFAFWDNPKLVTGIEEACVKDAEGCIESTANGWGTAYHKLWQRAAAGEADEDIRPGSPMFYSPHFYGWFWDPENFVPCSRPLEDLDAYEREIKATFNLSDGQLLWRRQKMAAMTKPEDFPQEYPATPEEAFLVSGLMVFSASALKKHEDLARPPQWVGEIRDNGGKTKLEPAKEGRMSIWIPPRAGSQYLISADIASGIEVPKDSEVEVEIVGGAQSVADVWDTKTWEQVAQWIGYVTPDDFGVILVMMGALYNWAFLAPEVNNHGLTTCCKIRDEGYPHYLVREDTAGGSDLGWYTAPGESGTRAQMLTNFRAAVRDFTCKINSKATISQCRSFVKKTNGKMGPQKGSFSDAVMSGAIGVTLLEQKYHIPEKDLNGGRSQVGVLKDRRIASVSKPKRGGYV